MERKIYLHLEFGLPRCHARSLRVDANSKISKGMDAGGRKGKGEGRWKRLKERGVKMVMNSREGKKDISSS